MSEIYKEIQAAKSRAERTDGFQACVNFQKGCDFGGFYLARYSPEGYCDDCEIKAFPQRYHGCCFCGKVIKYGSACWGCLEGVSQWLFNLFYNKNENSKSTTSIFALVTPDETNDWERWSQISIGIHSAKDCFYHGSKVTNSKKGGLTNEWPGFRISDNEWYKPNPYDLKEGIDLSGITWENKTDVIKRELEKKGIYLEKEYQFANPKKDVQI